MQDGTVIPEQVRVISKRRGAKRKSWKRKCVTRLFERSNVNNKNDIEKRTVTDEDLRAVGFTSLARDYQRGELALEMFAAWNGVTVDQMPNGFRCFPNEWTRDAWSRVADAAHAHITKGLTT